ncbi:MAG: VOC family protein [Alphaproteobacteria bacterium]|nr:VOC family protein [Alphaproteobacteria bacterium]
MDIELDHIFLFVQDETTARRMMAEAGLRVNYSRTHTGQGTSNVCACLDDMYLELLWLDGTPIDDQAERMTLGDRGRGRGCPIGVSWRGKSGLECECYAAPFLPRGATIPVARASLDINLPFVFQSPGGMRPLDRNDGLVGQRQVPALATLGHCELRVPNLQSASKLLSAFQNISVVEGEYGLRIELLTSDGTIDRRIKWAAASRR